MKEENISNYELTELERLFNEYPIFLDSYKNILAKRIKALNINAPLMVFDWKRAEHMIRESGAVNAGAFLEGDEGFTSDIIWLDGKPHLDTMFYPCSIWATPMLVIDSVATPCWVNVPNEPDLICEIDLPDPSQRWPEYQQAKRLEQ